MDIAGQEWDGTLEDIPNSVLIPSFMISELRMAFWIGFMIYIPFIVIDMVVASTLMSMGMMMLPPTTISMPLQDPAVRTGRRLGTDHRATGTDILLDS